MAASAGRYAGALFFPQDESGDAHKFTHALAAAAERQGVTFRYGVALRRLQANGGRITAVDTDQGRLEADAYVMSLGSFSPLFLRKVGIRVPIYPLKGYSVTVPTEGHHGAPRLAIHEGSRRIVMSRLGERLRSAGTAELTGYDNLRREVKYGQNTRIDMLLEHSGEPGRPDCYVEVKNVHLMRQPGLAEFPDSVTKRGAKHLVELGDMVANGHRAVMFYLVQRMDCDRFSVARDIDPTYAKELHRAMGRGVEAICYDCVITTTGIDVRGPIALALAPLPTDELTPE